jgi:hypothetical protein
MRTRAHMVLGLLLLIAAAGLLPAAALAVVPVSGTTPTLSPVTINDSAGDQSDPHVSGDWAAYTDGIAIRYYNFTTGVDAQIPMGASARDLLSDISGGKIVFSRVITGNRNAVMVFDAATGAALVEIDPSAGSNRLGSAIGGDTVAYIDFGLHPNGELVLHDLAGAGSVRITSDAAFDQNPSVSPDGGVVVWEHCASSSSNCDIWQGVMSGAIWNVSVVTDSANAEGNPDTNGTLVTYDSFRAGSSDVFWRPVAGGAEVQLEFSGYEHNPSMAGGFIVFESRPTLFDTTDLFAYEINRNRLYQITGTPLVTEQLNDTAVLPDGHLRLVWASDEAGFDQRNVKAATFRPALSTADQITELIALIESFNLRAGLENSLDVKLRGVQEALAAANAGDLTTACNKLDAFLNEVAAQSGKALTTSEAGQLAAAATEIKAVLGCS